MIDMMQETKQGKQKMSDDKSRQRKTQIESINIDKNGGWLQQYSIFFLICQEQY